jgi:two-component system sensor histidine kinase CpxA
LRSLGAQVDSQYELEGPGRAADTLSAAGRDGRFRAWLYSVDGRLLVGPDAVDRASEIVAAALASDETLRWRGGGSAILARTTASDAGGRYLIMWEAPLAAYRVSPLRFSIRVLALVLTGGLVCAWLTWQITRPVRTLRSAARQLAGGDLAVRVADRREFSRRDELSDLARDFDHMATRTQSLVDGQQRLLADISHELRSPLARLSLALDLARRRVGADLPEHDRIAREIARLDELIEQLLSLARLRGPSDGVLERVDIGDLARDVVHDARFEAEADNRAVVVRGDGPYWVRGNPALLRSAIDNVVRNAVRHAPAHSTVTVVLEPVVDRRVAIVVRDQGSGVPADALPRLFEPFFRVDESRDRSSGGTGLGLAIVYQAMLAHGGSATAENHADGGLAVRLELPLER